MNTFLLINPNGQVQHFVRISHITRVSFNEEKLEIIFDVDPGFHSDTFSRMCYLEKYDALEAFTFRRRWLKEFLNQEQP